VFDHACNARFPRVVATGGKGAALTMTGAAASLAIAHASPASGARPIPFAGALPHASLPPDAARDAIERIAHVGSWELCVNTGQTRWSAEMYRIVGLDPAAPPPPTYREQARRYAPETWQRIVAATDRAVLAGESFECAVELSREDGSRRALIVRGEPRLDSHGRVQSVIGTAQDVTDLEGARRDLLLATARHRLATQAASIGVWDWDIEAGCGHWDEVMIQLFGQEPGPALGLPAWTASVHPDDAARVEEAIRRCQADQEPLDVTFRVLRPGGDVRHIKATGGLHGGAECRPVHMLGTCLDVTRQREAELEILREKALLREFVRHAPAAIAMLDRDLRYLQVSERWLSEHGLVGQDIIGRGHYEIFPEMPEGRRETHQRALRGEVLHGEDQPIELRDGSVEWISWEVRPWHAHDGSVGGLMIFTLRTSARKRLELALERQKAELQRSNQELEQYAYIASHDLQEPLRAVVGCGQLLEQQFSAGLDPTAQQLVAHMVEGGLRMQRLVFDLLAYSRVGTGERRAVLVDTASALRQATAQLEVAIAETNASIEADELPRVFADPTQVIQLFQNLLGNALKYRSAERPRVLVRARRVGAFFELSVADNGIGIDPRYFERIFILFQRLHTRTAYPGTGIGLSLCRKIVERHGGRIWVESEPGRGATFFFTLPADGEAT
jgi:PAS domain S-box-containing protein